MSSASEGELVKLNCYRTGKEEAQGISDIIEKKLKKFLLMMFLFWLERFIKLRRKIFAERYRGWNKVL